MILAAALAAVCVTGCGPGEPKTHPVKGRVVLQGGDARQLAGGYVRLESVSDSKVTAVGEIEEDGTFALGSFIDGKGLGGVLPGTYRARVEPPSEDDGGGRRRAVIHPRFRSYEKSNLQYTIPTDQEIVIEVAGPGR